MERLILDVTDIESDGFSPQQLFFIGIDIFVNDIVIEWLSPMDVWVSITTLTESGRYFQHCAVGDTFRFTTSSAGSRVWCNWPG